MPPQPRLLLSGTGDSALLAVALDALAPHERAARLHVVDRCPTPLALCEEFAARRGVAIHTRAADVVELAADSRFDVILVHALLGFIEPARRGALFRRWHELLVPGGRLLMVQRLRPGAGTRPVRFSESQARGFVERVRKAAAAAALPIATPALLRAAGTYARRKRTHPVAGSEELESRLAHAGFRILRFDRPGPGAAAPAAGPSLREGAAHALLVAVRDG